MASQITGHEYPLSKVFSKEFEFHIPSYQRPYAWTEDEANTLFDDLYDFYQTNPKENYFLGSVVLVKNEKPHAEVIDGQQRLTTLTILLAVIASHFSGDQKATLAKYICEPGNEFESLKPSPRLYLREKERAFFEQVQNLSIQDILSLDPLKLDTEAKQHIVLNCKALNKKISENFSNNISSLLEYVQFLLQRCFIIIVSTPSQDSAFRVFSVMNSRGLDLLPIDIIKADTIGSLDSNLRVDYTEKWEELESTLTRSNFNELFAHIRMVFAKSKAQKSLLDEFKVHIWPHFSDKKDFIDEILIPYASSYNIIKNAAYKSTEDNDQINGLLKWLNRLDFADWIPVSIKFLASYEDKPKTVYAFFKKLECLAAYLHINSKDVNARIRRFSKILEELESINPIDIQDNLELESIELSEEEKNDFLAILNGEIYRMAAKRRNYVIMRLNSFVSDGAIAFDSKVLTIEHVLPQTVETNSLWAQWWTNEEDREKWVHRISNLVPLTRKINSSAQNFDFADKKNKYFVGKNGTSSYPLTTQVLTHEKWTPQIVVERQKTLLTVFENAWNLTTEKNNKLISSLVYTEKENNTANETSGAPTKLIENSILVAEICKSGSRWKQVNFSKEIFQCYFGADEEGNGHDIFITNIRPNGEACTIEQRKLVSVISSNYRIELNCEETSQDYPSGNERPIVVFNKTSQFYFNYFVIMPDDKNYEIISEFLSKIYTGKGSIKREITSFANFKINCPTFII